MGCRRGCLFLNENEHLTLNSRTTNISKQLNQDSMSATGDKIRGDWNDVKGKAKEQYGELTDDDMMVAEGKEDQFFGNLQKKLGKTKEEVMDWINSL